MGPTPIINLALRGRASLSFSEDWARCGRGGLQKRPTACGGEPKPLRVFVDPWSGEWGLANPAPQV